MAKVAFIDYCSIEANIVGVKFYPGIYEIAPMLRVRLVRELDNKHDKNSIVAQFLDSGTMLGHLDRRTASVVAPIMDTLTTEFLIKV